MSILIRGMEMPKSCCDCPCFDDDNDEYEYAICGISKKPIPWKWANSQGIDVIYLRPTDCPLIEVPTPHGRLIDVDKLDTHDGYVEVKLSKKEAEFSYIQFIYANDIANAPTVIESEET